MLGLLGVGFAQITTLPLDNSNTSTQDIQNTDQNSQAPTNYPPVSSTSVIEQ